MKSNKWQVKHYILSGIFAALTFATAFALGAGVIIATGIPATGGFVNIFAAVFVVMIGLKIVPKFGFGILTMCIMFTLAIPTVIGGPPGLYKIVIGLLIGLTFDTVIYLGKKTSFSYILAGSLGAVVSIVSVFLSLLLLQLPGVEQLQPLMKFLVPLQAITGALGAWTGTLVFQKRLSKISAIRRLLSENDKN